MRRNKASSPGIADVTSWIFTWTIYFPLLASIKSYSTCNYVKIDLDNLWGGRVGEFYMILLKP